MNNPRIGDNDCTIAQIVLTLTEGSCPLTYCDLKTLMLHIGTPHETTQFVQHQEKIGNGIKDSILAVLTEWKKRIPADATLQNLIKFLRMSNFNYIADNLETWNSHSNIYNKKPNVFSTTTTSYNSTYRMQSNEQSDSPTQDERASFTSVPILDNSESDACPNKASMTGIDCHLNSFKSSCSQINASECDNLLNRQQIYLGRENEILVFPKYYMWGILLLIAVVVALFLFSISLATGHIKILNNDGATLTSFQGDKWNHTNIRNWSSSMIEYEPKVSEEFDEMPITEQYFLHTRNETELLITTLVDLTDLFDPQTYWKNLVFLEFDKDLGLTCLNTTNPIFSTKIRLPKLKVLTLELFPHCEYFVDGILNYLDMNKLTVINLGGQINNDNIHQVQQFLHIHHKSLEEININGRLLGTINVFEIRNRFVLGFVKNISLHLNPFWHTTVDHLVITSRFCSIFPELARFETKNVSVSLDDLFKLQTCTNLQYLNTEINIGLNDSSRIESLKWHNQFPSLKYIAVKLHFQKCSNSINFRQILSNTEGLQKYYLCSNCMLSPQWGTYCSLVI